MPCFSLPNIELVGISAAVPENQVSNWDYDFLSENERKMLIKTTGIENRRVAPKGLTSSDLCFHAAEKLLEQLGWRKDEIDILIFLSQSTDYYLPATAIILQDRLGLSSNCMAFDVGLGCSGYVYGLSIIGGILSSARLRKGLLLVGDISSYTCSQKDKSTYPLFGDSGTATAIQFNPNANEIHFNLKSDGSGHEAIIIRDGGIRNLITDESFKTEKFEDKIERCRLQLEINGVDVFNFSIKRVHPSINELIEFADIPRESLDYFVMHQANKLMNETIRKKTGFTSAQTPYSLSKYGNTSSASIPLTIISELGNKTEGPINWILSGFGVGLSWGSAALRTENLICPPIQEIA